MHVTRRRLLRSAAVSASFALLERTAFANSAGPPLREFGYHQIRITGALQHAQRDNILAVLMGFDDDSLLKPFRAMAGRPAPGASIGGWYEWKPDYDHHHDDAGFAPGHALGQWTSALARFYAASLFFQNPVSQRPVGPDLSNPVSQNLSHPSSLNPVSQDPVRPEFSSPALRDKVNRLHALLAESISPAFFAQTRFASYTLDKLVCGLVDAHCLLADPTAFTTLDRVTNAAEPSLPSHAIDRDIQWKLGTNISWLWDEPYTLPENLFLASVAGAGTRYRRLAERFLLDTAFFEPLSRGVNVLGDEHAYSHVNALCSAMQAWFVNGSSMHLQAAIKGFDMLEQQSFATGGWGPEELLRKPGYDELAKSLTASHNSFEVPCGGYAHLKLTRYLLRATRDGRYGDSMEGVLHNGLLGVLPLQPDGRSFYSADYNVVARRIYSVHRWPCCSGTLPQAVADYGINTYLHEPGAIYVILYQPSELRWTEAGHDLSLQQITTYPDSGTIRLRLTALRPTPFTLRLRIPGWAGDGATLEVNRRPFPVSVDKGFTSISRIWRNGDTIELTLPITLRLESFPADGSHQHTETVALLRGPLVLFALRETGESGPLTFTKDALLSAQQTSPREWTSGTRRFVSFPDLGDRSYTTYLNLPASSPSQSAGPKGQP